MLRLTVRSRLILLPLLLFHFMLLFLNHLQDLSQKTVQTFPLSMVVEVCVRKTLCAFTTTALAMTALLFVTFNTKLDPTGWGVENETFEAICIPHIQLLCVVECVKHNPH